MSDLKREMVNHKPFDLQEAVILLDVYLSIKKKGVSNTESAEIASQRLRLLAHKRGMKIGASFRSAMGLQNRLRSIGCLFEGTESDSAPGTQIFREAVALYRMDKQQYMNLLEEGNVWIQFDFTNSQKFERTIPTYCSINGQRLEGKNWARILVEIVERELTKHNPLLESLYEQPLLPNRKERPFFLKEKIEGLNCSKLSNGYWINVNYSIPHLMNQIEALCLLCGYDEEQIFIYGMPKENDWAKKDDSLDQKQTSSSVNVEKVEAYLAQMGLQGATVQSVIKDVQPGVSGYSIQNALRASQNVISMPGDRYVHAEAFVDLDEAKKAMQKILQTHFAQFGGYSNHRLLFGAASHDLSLFLNDNDCEDIDRVYALAHHFFGEKAGKQYEFLYPHIFENVPDFPHTLKGLMINMARINGGVLNADDAKEYLQKAMLSYGSIGQVLQIASSDTFLIYDSNQYLLSEKMGMDEMWRRILHDQLDDLFRQANVAFVIPRDIEDSWFASLPVLPQNLGWTVLLLQEVLKKCPDIGFWPVTAELGQAHNTIAAAFVPINSSLQSFADVVTLFMQEKYSLPKRMTCEELRQELREAGMLEGNELIHALPKALNDYRFSWTDENKMVLVRGN